MEKINTGDVVVLLMNIKSPETPFFANVGSHFKVQEITIDPFMPSGYSVKIKAFGNSILVDRSAVVHVDDWNNIHNAVINKALRSTLK